jgi:hypothetical protein
MIKQIMTIITAAVFLYAGDFTADQILDSIEKNETSQTSRIEMTQKVYRSNGTVSESELVSYSMDEGDKSLMIYSKPSRIDGMKILTLNDGDDIWFYSPRTGRTRKIASHQKNQSVNGSDFSYDDLNSDDRRENYNTKITGTEEVDGITCTVLELIMKEGLEESYSKMVMKIDTERWLPLETHFFDEIGELWKVLTMDGIEKVGNYWNAKVITMKNVQKESRTDMLSSKTEFDIEVDASMFTERYLSR